LRSMDSRALEEEARALASQGVRELVLVAQDLTAYGADRREKGAFLELLNRIKQVEGIQWIRLMYVHPEGIPRGLATTINESENILPYLDIPFQHVSDAVLRAMGRPWKGDRIRNLVDRLRTEIPGLVLRTTLMVGFPGEGDKEFAELAEFVESFVIERVGVFTYSPEEGTPAHTLGDPVAQEVKEARANEIRRIHSRSIEQRNRSKIGSLEPSLIEGISEETELLLQARTWDQAPEVDGILYITAGNAVVGEIRPVKITGFHGEDLFGELVE
jgi:ribosomal protein S12 methylthiotransferase